MNRRAELPEQLQAEPFSRRKAMQSGVSAGRLKAHDLERPFHGVFCPMGSTSRPHHQLRAYQERMNPAHVFSHHSAAKIYGLPLPLYASADNRVHVAVSAPGRAPAGAGVAGHRLGQPRWSRRDIVLRDIDADQIYALPASDPEFVWAQLAEHLDVGDLVALGDAIVGRTTGPDIRGDRALADTNDLRRVAELHRGSRGAKAMEAAVEYIRPGSLSRPESLLRFMLVRAGLPEPVPNIRVDDAKGRLIAMPDLCWPEFRLLIEYQGDGHRVSKSKFRSDITRLEEFADGDWFAMQASADDVFGDPNPFAGRVWRRLVARGWNPRRRQLRHIVGARW